MKPVYARKCDMNGTMVRNKVRYCVKGYRQVYGHDYTCTTSPTARLESFRAILHVAASRGWDIQQINVKTAFLNADLPPDEYQYTHQLCHFEERGKETWVWMLVKSLYGLKQAGHAWNHHMHNAMVGWGFQRMMCEWCVYIWQNPNGSTILVAIHVNDMLAAVSIPTANDTFKAQLKSKWAILDLGNMKYYLGIAVVRDPERLTIHLSQTALIDHIIEQFHQIDAYPVATPWNHAPTSAVRRLPKPHRLPKQNTSPPRCTVLLLGASCTLLLERALTLLIPSTNSPCSWIATPQPTGWRQFVLYATSKALGYSR
jgi:hypothetical protein